MPFAVLHQQVAYVSMVHTRSKSIATVTDGPVSLSDMGTGTQHPTSFFHMWPYATGT